MDYVQLRFDTDAASADAAADLVSGAGALAVALEAADDLPLFDIAGSGGALWPRTRITGLFAADCDLPGVLAGVWDALGWRDPPRFTLEPLADTDWEAHYRAQFEPQHFGTLTVRPSWAAVPGGGAVDIVLDPGLAFGTGAHATTAMCLRWLDRSGAVAGATVIDYGCGSGILAIAAAKLGAARVYAIDIDTRALAVAAENAARNTALETIEIGMPELLATQRADVLLANILLEPLLVLAPRFAELIVPGGWIVLTGLLAEQAESCARAYHPYFSMAAPEIDAGWALLAGRRMPC